MRQKAELMENKLKNPTYLELWFLINKHKDITASDLADIINNKTKRKNRSAIVK